MGLHGAEGYQEASCGVGKLENATIAAMHVWCRACSIEAPGSWAGAGEVARPAGGTPLTSASVLCDQASKAFARASRGGILACAWVPDMLPTLACMHGSAVRWWWLRRQASVLSRVQGVPAAWALLAAWLSWGEEASWQCPPAGLGCPAPSRWCLLSARLQPQHVYSKAARLYT